jgi:hypothetical protein
LIAFIGNNSNSICIIGAEYFDIGFTNKGEFDILSSIPYNRKDERFNKTL